MSMPARMLLAVVMLPSTTMGSSGRSEVRGKRSRKKSTERKCVVAFLPTSSPASASSREPVPTDASRSTCGAILVSHSRQPV